MGKLLEGISLIFGAIIDILLRRTQLMTTLQELKDALAVVKNGLVALKDAIDVLKNKPGAITQQDLDDLGASVGEIQSQLDLDTADAAS